jgi:hypothetical protein
MKASKTIKVPEEILCVAMRADVSLAEAYILVDKLRKARPTQTRPCALCHRLKPKSGRYRHHDPCIKNMPGVVNACCGHGVTNGYFILNDEAQTYYRCNFKFDGIGSVTSVHILSVEPMEVAVRKWGKKNGLVETKPAG